MRKQKDLRKLKVYSQSGYNYKDTPTIQLKGQWLKDFDFDSNTLPFFRCGNNVLFVFVDIMKHTFMRLPTFLFFAKPMNNSGLEQDCKAQAEEYDRQNELWESESTISAMAKSFAGETKLTRQMVNAFIENVYIYNPKRVEIIFRHEDEVAKLAESLRE